MMSVLVGGASTQSRVKRPLPDGWTVRAIRREGTTEEWQVRVGKRKFNHKVLTWVFDQGGPVLGYTGPRNPHTKDLLEFVRGVQSQGMYGPASVSTDLEHQAADLLVLSVENFIRGDNIMMRWLANGSDAVDCAVRLARAYTKRDHIVSVGYHGSSIWFGHSPQNGGIPRVLQNQRTDLKFDDGEALNHVFNGRNKIAAVVVEVPSEDQFASQYLRWVRDLCDKYGALMILDEVVTGFRLAFGGAGEYYGVQPDVACYGKAMSNGRGISAVVGRNAILRLLLNQVFYSNTYNGDPYNCAHVIGTLHTMIENKDDLFPHLWEIGERLRDGLNGLGLNCVGHGPRTAIVAPEETATAFSKAMIEKGFVMNRPNYASRAHSFYAVRQTLNAAQEVMKTI